MNRTSMGVLKTLGATLLLACSCLAGPFEFEYGMTREQVIKLVGKAAVKEERGDMLALTTAPKPHEMFESYTLYISPEHGLLKIVAISREITTSKYGDEMRDQFELIRTGLQRVYGQPTDTFNFLKEGSIWNEPQDWMMGLLKKERYFDAAWTFKPPREHLTVVSLRANAYTTEAGSLSLVYEFEGWEQYVDEREGKKADVF